MKNSFKAALSNEETVTVVFKFFKNTIDDGKSKIEEFDDYYIRVFDKDNNDITDDISEIDYNNLDRKASQRINLFKN